MQNHFHVLRHVTLRFPSILIIEDQEEVPAVSIYLLGSSVYIRSKLRMRLACVDHTTKNHDEPHPSAVDAIPF